MKKKLFLYVAMAIGGAALITLLFNPTIFYVLIAVALFIGVIYLCSEYKWARIATTIVLALANTAGAMYSFVCLNGYYGAKGGIFGTIKGIFDTNQVQIVDDMTFNFGNVELVKTAGDDYQAIININQVLKLENKKFGVFVNNTPCDFVENGEDFVRANYNFIFYNDEREEVLKDTLKFRFTFNKNTTQFKITTSGGYEAVSYWNSYFAREEFKVTIKEGVYSNDGSIDTGSGIVSYALANYYINEEKYITQLYHIGDLVTFPVPEEQSRYLGWSTDKINIVQSHKITGHVDFYAVFADYEIYTVNYYFKYQIIDTQRLKENETLQVPRTVNVKGYTFKYWTLDKTTEYDFSNYTVTQNLNIYGKFDALQNKVKVTTVINGENKYYLGLARMVTGGSIYALPEEDGTIQYRLVSGKSGTVRMPLIFANFQLTQGRVKYKVIREEGDTSIVSVSELQDGTSYGGPSYKEQVTINIDNPNSNLEILLYIEPLELNITFMASMGDSSMAPIHVNGIIFGEKVTDLKSYFTQTAINFLTKNSKWTFQGFYTKSIGQGKQYVDSNFNMINNFTETGYKHNDSIYEKSPSYDEETRTFEIYAFLLGK